MTATCDRDLLGQLEILTGLTFLANNIFWPDVIGIQSTTTTTGVATTTAADAASSSPLLGG